MRNYIILNNQNSNTISGLIIQELAPISKPLQRTQVETIDGRDGDIVTPLGYAAYNKKIKIGLYGNFDINEVIAYFATKGTAIFSNEPDKYYYYQIVDQIDYERLVRYRVATVTMHVQPFKYSATEGTITVDASDTVSGEGSNIALDGTAEAPFNILRHKGNATQTTYTGKNVLNTNALNRTLPFTSTSRGVTFTVDSDGSITINGQNDGTGNSLISIYTRDQIPLTLTAGQYTGDLNPVDGVYRAVNMMSYDGASYKSFRQNSTQTLTANNHSIYIQVVNGEQTTFTNYKIYPMLEAGSTKSPYEPYVGGIPSPNPDYPQDIQVLTGDSTVKIMGKNLLTFDGKEWGSPALDIAEVGSNSVKLTPNASSGAYANKNVIYKLKDIGLKTGDTITISADITGTYATDANKPRIRIYGKDSSSPLAVALSPSDNIRTLTIPDDTDQIMLYFYVRDGQTPASSSYATFSNIQLELGGQATDYEEFKGQSYVIPFGDTYLAKIGDYADEPVNVDGTWYIRRAIGKASVSLSGLYNITGGLKGAIFNPGDKIYNFNVGSLCTKATAWRAGTYWDGCYYENAANFMFVGSSADTTASLKTKYDGATIYYILATPTDEAITDQDLIDALDELYDQAHSYKGHTHITATAADGNAPAVLSVEVGEDNESTVTNAGNTTSRPILTIYGQGDIGVYINDVEVLDVALGDEGYITLDSVEMEAYKDTTANLKNRLVTGDYSKLALNAGANKIRFTGIVTKYEISKYSRWL